MADITAVKVHRQNKLSESRRHPTPLADLPKQSRTRNQQAAESLHKRRCPMTHILRGQRTGTTPNIDPRNVLKLG